jgi:alkanesulfonate monooxygenase
MELLWYLVPNDGPYPWDPKGVRKVDFRYLQSMARSFDVLGFDGALLATGVAGGQEPWVLASSLITHTERLKFLIAVHTPLYHPTSLVKLVTTFDQFSNGRLLLNVINGADEAGFAAAGVHLGHDERYAHCDEFLTVYRRIMQGETVDFDGKYLSVRGAKVTIPPVTKPYPPLWFGGQSEAARAVAGRHIDRHLSWGEPPPMAAETVADLRQRAAQVGREIHFGSRLYVIVRETKEKAWEAAQDLLDHMDPEIIAAAQRMNNAHTSIGQRRQTSFVSKEKPRFAQELEFYPNLWSGLGLIRPGPGVAIVGDAETVAQTLHDYRDAGVDAFILSGVPLVEEAYRFADLVMPLLDREPLSDGREEVPVITLSGATVLKSQHPGERALSVH